MEVEKMDINAICLHSKLKEENFVKKSKVFMVEGRENMLFQLKRTLYGLK
jgi:hypothetical protein